MCREVEYCDRLSEQEYIDVWAPLGGIPTLGFYDYETSYLEGVMDVTVTSELYPTAYINVHNCEDMKRRLRLLQEALDI